MFKKIFQKKTLIQLILPIFILGLFAFNFSHPQLVQAQSSDLNLLPQYNNLFDFLYKGVIVGFLLKLSPIVGLLAIVWGGYQYYFGSFTGKSDGMKAITAGAIGLLITAGYSIFISFDDSGAIKGGLLADTVKDGGLKPDALIKFIQETLLNNFLLALSGVVAVLAMVYGGYQYIASPLNKEAGIKTIQNAAIGLTIILLASVIKNFIQATFANNTINKDPVINLAKEVISNFLLPLSSVVTLAFLVYGGYQWITAQEPSQVKDAQKSLKNALIGFVVVLLSFTVTQLLVYIVTNLKIGG